MYMFHRLIFICFIGAVVRLLFYRLGGNREITMKYLLAEENEQQMTSFILGILILIIFGFVLTKIILI